MGLYIKIYEGVGETTGEIGEPVRLPVCYSSIGHHECHYMSKFEFFGWRPAYTYSQVVLYNLQYMHFLQSLEIVNICNMYMRDIYTLRNKLSITFANSRVNLRLKRIGQHLKKNV